METALDFWRQADINKLAKEWRYDEKLPYEIKALLPHIATSKGIWDAAAGNNRIVDALREKLSCKFISTDLVKNHPHFVLAHDIKDGIPEFVNDEIDTVLLFGVIQYLSDDCINTLFRSLTSRKVIIKTPCDKNSTYVCDFSEKLGAKYEALYRSASTVMAILKKTHIVTHCSRVYPDELESRFGTIQWLFVGEPCG